VEVWTTKTIANAKYVFVPNGTIFHITDIQKAAHNMNGKGKNFF